MQIKLKKVFLFFDFSTCTNRELIQPLLSITHKFVRYKQYCFGNCFFFITKNAFKLATFSFVVLKKELLIKRENLTIYFFPLARRYPLFCSTSFRQISMICRILKHITRSFFIRTKSIRT